MKSNKLNFKKIKIGDWIKFRNSKEKIIIAKIEAKLQHGITSDLYKKVSCTFTEKNINLIGVRINRTRAFFKLGDLYATKILDVDKTGDLKDIAIRRLIRLKGLDQ